MRSARAAAACTTPSDAGVRSDAARMERVGICVMGTLLPREWIAHSMAIHRTGLKKDVIRQPFITQLICSGLCLIHVYEGDSTTID